MSRNEPTYSDTRRTLADIRLGQAIRAARLQCEWTQTELAEKLTETTGQRWDQVKVSNFETSRRLLSVGQALQVTHVLQVPLSGLLVVDGTNATQWALDSRPNMPVQGYPVDRTGDV